MLPARLASRGTLESAMCLRLSLRAYNQVHQAEDRVNRTLDAETRDGNEYLSLVSTTINELQGGSCRDRDLYPQRRSKWRITRVSRDVEKVAWNDIGNSVPTDNTSTRYGPKMARIVEY